MEHILLYVGLGSAAGILAGMLGIGGGIVLVPGFLYLFQSEGLPQQFLVHFAIGTSMACVLFTSASSTLSHNRRRNIDWALVRTFAAFVALGALGGAALTPFVDAKLLRLGVAVFQCWVATTILVVPRPEENNRPWAAPRALAGMLIGSVASVVGIAGGTLLVGYFVGNGVDMKKAVGSSAALGIPLAGAGVAGYLGGQSVDNAASLTAGFLYLPALAYIVPAAALTAPLGVRIASAMPTPAFKKLFAFVLYVVAARMVWSVIT